MSGTPDAYLDTRYHRMLSTPARPHAPELESATCKVLWDSVSSKAVVNGPQSRHNLLLPSDILYPQRTVIKSIAEGIPPLSSATPFQANLHVCSGIVVDHSTISCPSVAIHQFGRPLTFGRLHACIFRASSHWFRVSGRATPPKPSGKRWGEQLTQIIRRWEV